MPIVFVNACIAIVLFVAVRVQHVTLAATSRWLSNIGLLQHRINYWVFKTQLLKQTTNQTQEKVNG